MRETNNIESQEAPLQPRPQDLLLHDLQNPGPPITPRCSLQLLKFLIVANRNFKKLNARESDLVVQNLTKWNFCHEIVNHFGPLNNRHNTDVNAGKPSIV